MPTARHTLSYLDYSNESSSFTVSAEIRDDTNFDAQVTLADALITATNALTLGNLNNQFFTQGEWSLAAVPSDVLAQRENKWLVRYEDGTTGKKYTVEIPTAELASGHLQTNSDEANLADAEWVAFIAAFEAYAVAPDTGNTVNFISARFVARNL